MRVVRHYLRYQQESREEQRQVRIENQIVLQLDHYHNTYLEYHVERYVLPSNRVNIGRMIPVQERLHSEWNEKCFTGEEEVSYLKSSGQEYQV